MKKGKLCLLMILALLFVSGCATTPRRIMVNHADLSGAEIEKRTRFIEERLAAHKQHAQIWYWSWMAVNCGATVGLSIAAGVTDKTPDRVDFISQAVLAGLGVADLLLRPLEARYGDDPHSFHAGDDPGTKGGKVAGGGRSSFPECRAGRPAARLGFSFPKCGAECGGGHRHRNSGG